MHLSPKGFALIKSFEGCLKPVGNGRFTTYICPAGVLTIGWGHTNDGGRSFKSGDVWTQGECDAALTADMGRYESAVARRVTAALNQNQFDALVSFTYNCGEGNLAKSTLLRKLNAGDYAGAAEQFGVWNRGAGQVLAGLTRRRAAERALFLQPVAGEPSVAPRVDPPVESVPPVPTTPENPMPQGVDPPAADKPSIFEKLWTWVSTFLGTGVMAYLTDWRVVVAIGALLLISGAALVWFMGPESVRAWIRQKVNR